MRRRSFPWLLAVSPRPAPSTRQPARLVAAALVVVAVASCGRAEPSRTPLSVTTRSGARTEPSSSRAVEASDDDDGHDELEIVVSPSDDDGDDPSTGHFSAATGRAQTPSTKGSLPGRGAKTTPDAAPARATSVCAAAAGAAPDCASLAPASSCLGASIAQRACEKLGPAVDPRVGAAWMTCMRDPSNGSACDSQRIALCGLRAVGNACVDGVYHSLCAEIATACSDVAEQITAPVCEQLIAAWKPERRSQMIECLRHGCETGGFGVCLP